MEYLDEIVMELFKELRENYQRSRKNFKNNNIMNKESMEKRYKKYQCNGEVSNLNVFLNKSLEEFIYKLLYEFSKDPQRNILRTPLVNFCKNPR